MKYSDIWNSIKLSDTPVHFTVSKAAAPTVIQGVKKLKSGENVTRRLVGLRGWSKLVIETEELSPTMLKVTMKLLYQTMRL